MGCVWLTSCLIYLRRQIDMPYKYATQNCEHCKYCVKTDKYLYCSHREGHPKVTGGSWCIDRQEGEWIFRKRK